jgi:hypothetical protein
VAQGLLEQTQTVVAAEEQVSQVMVQMQLD